MIYSSFRNIDVASASNKRPPARRRLPSYFLWWTDATVADLRARLRDPDPERRAYWMGALLREANTRDVWLFVTPEVIRESWSPLQRHLGQSRSMWAYLLDLEADPWPPVASPPPR
jgi:hypothetical protein